jgi:hypothetical protein
MSHFELFDIALIRHLADKSKGIPEYLIKRLGNANTRRRQLLEYYERHHEKIAAPQPQLDPTPEPEQAKIPTQEANTGQDNTPAARGQDITTKADNATLPPATAEQTTVTTFYEAARDVPDARSDTGHSETSFAPTESTAAGGHELYQILVPRCPNQERAYNGEPFQCPYCFTVIVITSPISWK